MAVDVEAVLSHQLRDLVLVVLFPLVEDLQLNGEVLRLLLAAHAGEVEG